MALRPSPSTRAVPSTVYQGTVDTGVLKTTDGGAHWTIASSTLGAGTSIFDLAINPATPSTLLATASNNTTARNLAHHGQRRDVDSGLAPGGYLAFAPLTPSIVYTSINSTPVGVLKSDRRRCHLDAGVHRAYRTCQVGQPRRRSVERLDRLCRIRLRPDPQDDKWRRHVDDAVRPTAAPWSHAVAVDPTLTSVVWAGAPAGICSEVRRRQLVDASVTPGACG